MLFTDITHIVSNEYKINNKESKMLKKMSLILLFIFGLLNVENPEQTGHLFRFNSDTHFGINRTPISVFIRTV